MQQNEAKLYAKLSAAGKKAYDKDKMADQNANGGTWDKTRLLLEAGTFYQKL